MQGSVEIKLEHKAWGDEDKSKHFDFDSQKYWISTNDEQLIGMDDFDELLEYMDIERSTFA